MAPVKKPNLEAAGTRRADHLTSLYPRKLAPNSPNTGGSSVGIVRLRTKGHGGGEDEAFRNLFSSHSLRECNLTSCVHTGDARVISAFTRELLQANLARRRFHAVFCLNAAILKAAFTRSLETHAVSACHVFSTSTHVSLSLSLLNYHFVIFCELRVLHSGLP
jgi:hypothetical protein